MLEAWADTYRSYASFASGYGSAVLDRVEPPVAVTIVGKLDDPVTAALLRAGRAVAVPPVRIEIVDPIRMPDRLAALGQPVAADSIAYLCDERACFARTSDPEEIARMLSHARG